MDRIEVASALREIGARVAASGGNRFRARAYERGARAIEALNADLGELVEAERIREVPGIGPALAAVVAELVRAGRSGLLEELRARVPAGMLELRQVRHLTPRRIDALQRALGISSVAQLKQACLERRVRAVKGFGERLERELLATIAEWEARGTALLLHEAEREGESVLEFVRGIRGVRVATLAGELRRRVELVDSITVAIGAAAKDTSSVLRAVLRYPPAAGVVERTPRGCAFHLNHGVLVRVEAAVPSRHAPLLLHLTGSPAHVAKLAAIARERGLVLERDGLRSVARRRGIPTRGGASSSPAGRLVRVRSEEELYRALGLPPIPPEMREDAGEIEAAREGTLVTDLIEAGDVRGMVHCHTVDSDGRASIEEMARAAEAMGMEYITITDHSPAAHYAHGLSVDRLQAQWDEIERVQPRVRIRILRGTECDILADGSLDFPERVLERLDVVIASIHQRHRMDASAMTRRLVAAMRHPLFKIWGHALGRYVRSRPPIECRMDEVLDAAAQSRVAIEVNGDPYRLDLEPRWQREARRRGIPFVVSTDAHSTAQLANLRFAIAMARRGWLTPAEVLNTRPVEAFAAAVRPA